MLDMLLESGARSGRSSRPRDVAVSVVVHGVLVVAAVVATAPAARRLANAVNEVHMVFVPQRQPVLPPEPAPMRVSSINVPAASWTIRVPTVVPPTIPPIEPGAIRDETTVCCRTIPLTRVPSGVSPDQGVYLDAAVERAVAAYPDNPSPAYPPSLQSMGFEGDVVVQFVVDTLGRVEMPSVKFVRSSHELFERAVRDALARARYHPAQIGGVCVRQLVEQRFAFAIRKF